MGPETAKPSTIFLNVTEKSRCFLRKCNVSSDKCEECEVCNVLGLFSHQVVSRKMLNHHYYIVVVHCI